MMYEIGDWVTYDKEEYQIAYVDVNNRMNTRYLLDIGDEMKFLDTIREVGWPMRGNSTLLRQPNISEGKYYWWARDEELTFSGGSTRRLVNEVLADVYAERGNPSVLMVLEERGG